jgi:hypothetical protein
VPSRRAWRKVSNRFESKTGPKTHYFNTPEAGPISADPEYSARAEVSDSSAKDNCLLTLSHDDNKFRQSVVQAITVSEGCYAPSGASASSMYITTNPESAHVRSYKRREPRTGLVIALGVHRVVFAGSGQRVQE